MKNFCELLRPRAPPFQKIKRSPLNQVTFRQNSKCPKMFENNRSHVSTCTYALKYDLVIQRKKIRFGSSFTLNETLAYLYKLYIRNNKFLLHIIWKTIKSCCKINHSTKMKYFVEHRIFFWHFAFHFRYWRGQKRLVVFRFW